MKWSRWPPSPVPATKFQVKVKPLRLEGYDVVGEGEKTIAIEMAWRGSKSGLMPFHRLRKVQRSFSSTGFARRRESIEWEDEFGSVCNFSASPKHAYSFAPWEVSFKILHVMERRLVVLGKATLDLAELAAQMEARIERSLPITLQAAGFSKETALLICVSFVEIRSSGDSRGLVQNVAELDRGFGRNAVESRKEDGFLRRLMLKKNAKKLKTQETRVGFGVTDESTTFDSDGSHKNESSFVTTDTELTSSTEWESSPSPETRLDKRRRSSFTGSTSKIGVPLIKNISGGSNNNNEDDKNFDVDSQLRLGDSFPIGSVNTDSKQIANGSQEDNLHATRDDSPINGSWELKELVSRDGQAKLEADVFFASFDQCSEKAAGESACAALVAVIAHWLHSNQHAMPTRLEFDNLITEGSSKWRKLCDNEASINFFPDKHFDLETVLHAGLMPLAVLPEKSFIGFFSPDRFEYLKGAMSFDEIWIEITRNLEDHKPNVYIVSWNDHFFVLKVEANACYVIDTLGERLFEGCDQAYILKFDGSTSMYEKEKKAGVGLEKMDEPEPTTEKEEEKEEIICSGKDCCREFIKRFLAAIPLGELEEEEKKGTVSTLSLHQRLQIEFHFSSSPSTSSSSSSASSSPATLLLNLEE